MSKAEKVKLAMLSMQRYSWEQGVASHAFIDRGEDDLVVWFAEEAVLRQHDDGRLAYLWGDKGVTDPAANGEAVLKAAEITGSSELKKAAEKMLAFLMKKAPKTSDGILHHRTDVAQIWIDSMYMAPPFLAAMEEYEEAVKQISGFRKYLYNEDDQLYSHIYDLSEKKFERKAYWGGGNGWTAAGIARVMSFLPKSYAEEMKLLQGYLQEVIEGCLKYQRKDGLFHDVINDPASFVETNLAQMLAYSIYTGVKNRWLDRKYIDSADKMRKAANNKVDEFGFVTGACGAPYFNSPGRSTEAQAFYLLMEVAADKTA